MQIGQGRRFLDKRVKKEISRAEGKERFGKLRKMKVQEVYRSTVNAAE